MTLLKNEIDLRALPDLYTHIDGTPVTPETWEKRRAELRTILSEHPRQVPDFNEQTRVANGHPRCNSRIYPTCLSQLEKTHETSLSPRDEARFPCIACRAIAFSQSNT